jgi:hypothetical protein
MINPRSPALRLSTSLRENPDREKAALFGLGRSVRTAPAEGCVVDRRTFVHFVLILTILLIAYLAVGPSTNADDWGLVNAVCPAVLLLATLWIGCKSFITNPRIIWAPFPWFALKAALNYGFGPLLYFLGSEADIAYANSYWPVSSYDLWRTNLLNTVSLLTIAVVFLIVDKLLENKQYFDRAVPPEVAGDTDRARTAALVFLLAGLPLRYGLVLPFEFGALGFVLPGSLVVLNSLCYLAVFMLSYLGTKRRGLWRGGFWLLFVMESITHLLTFAKGNLIKVFIMAALGRFMAKRDFKTLVFSGIATVIFYLAFLSTFTGWARTEIAHENGGSIFWAPLSLRLSVAARGLGLWLQGEMAEDYVEHRSWLTRQCYTSQQNAALHLYDAGVVGDSYMFALYGWIPRYLWPDKPLMLLGQDFNELTQRARGTYSGPGAFGEAYWNGGWLLVILSCAYMGVLFAWLSHTALRMMARSEWLLLPCAFIGIEMGLYLDNWFAPTYIMGFMFYLLYYLLIRLIFGNAQTKGGAAP